MWVAVEVNAGTFGSNVIRGKQPPFPWRSRFYLAMIATHSNFLIKPTPTHKRLFKAVERFLH
jgi:hypothetical protein